METAVSEVQDSKLYEVKIPVRMVFEIKATDILDVERKTQSVLTSLAMLTTPKWEVLGNPQVKEMHK